MKGFTLIELLVVIVILVILGAVVFIVINPFEIQKRGRDATRISDLANLQTALNQVVPEATSSSSLSGISYPVTGSTRNIDGSGWVKADMSARKGASMPVLPTDPINDSTYNYRYYSDGKGWKIDATLESQQYQGKTVTDGGNCDSRYEVGSNLTLQGC